MLPLRRFAEYLRWHCALLALCPQLQYYYFRALGPSRLVHCNSIEPLICVVTLRPPAVPLFISNTAILFLSSPLRYRHPLVGHCSRPERQKRFATTTTLASHYSALTRISPPNARLATCIYPTNITNSIINVNKVRKNIKTNRATDYHTFATAYHDKGPPVKR